MVTPFGFHQFFLDDALSPACLVCFLITDLIGLCNVVDGSNLILRNT